MKYEGNKLFFEKVDLIRLNRLVRFRTDYSSFRDWYQSLNTDEQAALIGQLCNFAYQAGDDDSVFQTAAQDAGFIQEQEFLVLMKRVRGPSGLNVGGFVHWVRSATAPERDRAFRYFVYLFGEAERRLIQHENRQTCNNWWHRNLDDPRVVEDILNNKEYYKTSPRDDDALISGPDTPHEILVDALLEFAI